MIKAKVRLNGRKPQMFPKNNQRYEDGEFAILCFDLIEEIEGNVIMNQYGNIIIKGNMPYIDDTDIEYTVTLKESPSSFGMQYDCLYIGVQYEIKTDEQKRIFLSSFLTEIQVDSLFEQFEDPIIPIEQGDIESLCKVKGIGESTARNMILKYEENSQYTEAIVELVNYGLTLPMIKKLASFYGSPSTLVKKMKDNVYELADEIDGIGFKKADEMAINNGMELWDDRRLIAYITHILTEGAEQGFSWIDSSILVDKIIGELYEHDIKDIIRVVSLLKEEGVLWNGEHGKVALQSYYDLERKIAKELLRIANGVSHLEFDGWEDRVLQAEKLQGWEFTDEQRDGIEQCLRNNLMVITGKGGSGKSSTVLGAVMALGDVLFAQCALSGKASARLEEVTGYKASTIHRLLNYSPNNYEENGNSVFGYNKKCPLYHDIIILDELSMVGGSLFLSLIEAIPTGSKLILLGDMAQLPSIGSLSLQRDVIESPVIPTVTLTKIHRQAQKSAIITDSIAMSEGGQIIESDFTGKQVRGELQDFELDIYHDKDLTVPKILEHFREKLKWANNEIMDVQVIVPMNTRGASSVYKLNLKLQEIYNPEGFGKQEIESSQGKDMPFVFRIGDKILNTKNNYQILEDDTKLKEGQKPETIPVFNGYTGVVIGIRKGNLIVDFPILKKTVVLPYDHWRGNFGVQLGYASTCHKQQGSSIKYPICAIDYGHYTMLTREWVYTGITRTSKYGTLIAENKALRYAVTKTATMIKQTFLQQLLLELSS